MELLYLIDLFLQVIVEFLSDVHDEELSAEWQRSLSVEGLGGGLYSVRVHHCQVGGEPGRQLCGDYSADITSTF